MKKLQPIYAVLLTLFLLYAFSSNPPNGNTGAPGDGNCTNCHSGSNNNFDGLVSIQGLPSIIESGNTYKLNVVTKVTTGSPVRAGFQMVVLDENNDNVGAFANADNNAAITEANGKSYFEHDPALNFNGVDSVAWTVDWTAPTSINTDSVKIYINSILGNGSGSSNDLQISNQTTFGFQVPMVEPIEISVTSTDATCSGSNDGTAEAVATGGNGNYTFSWSNGVNTSVLTNLNAGNYTVTVTDTENNSNTATITINEPSKITITLDNLDKVTCTNNTITVQPVINGGTGDYAYQWSNSDTTASVELPVGDHSLTVTDENLCSLAASFSIEADTIKPNVSIGPDITVTCADTNTTTTQLAVNSVSSGPAFQYVWTTENGNILSGDSTLMPMVDTTGSYVLTVTNTLNGCISTDTVNIRFNTALPIANAGPDQQIGCETTSIILKGIGSSTGENINYEWLEVGSDAIALDSLEVTRAGTYILRVVNNQTNCSVVDTVIITQDATIPNISVSDNITLGCNESDTTQIMGMVNISDNLAFSWSSTNGIIISDINQLALTVAGQGIYTIMATDTTNGCSAMASVEVTQSLPPELNAEAVGELNCANTSITLVLNSNYRENIVYEWTTEEGNIVEGMKTDTPVVNLSGIYTVLVTDTITGCTSMASVMVAESNNSEVFAASGDAEQLTCTQSSITLNANGTQGENIVYEWTTETGNIVADGNTLMPEIDAPGRYTLLVTDTITGCSASSFINIAQDVNIPTVSAGTAQVLNCANTSVTLNGSSATQFNLTYTWTSDNGVIDSGANTPNAMVSTAGTYTLTVIDTFTNCSNSASVEVSADNELPLVGVVVTGQLDCDNDTLDLLGTSSAGEGIIHFWSTEDGNILTDSSLLLIKVNTAGTYTLTVTDTIAGCSASESVIVLSDTEKPMVEAGPAIQSFCDNSTLSINATVETGDNFIYFWCTENGDIIEGAETPNVVIDGPGLFEFIVTNTDNGCKSIDTIMVNTFASPTLSIDTIGDSTFIAVAGGTMPFLYSWTADSLDENTSLSELSAGDYALTISDANGCSDEITFTIESNTSLAAIESSIENWQVFPNPVKDYFNVNISFNTPQLGRILIINNTGQPIWQQTFNNQQILTEVDASSWSAGVYFMLVETEKGIKTEEILVIK